MSQHALEWSQSDNVLRVRSVPDLLAKNQECFINNQPHDSIVLMVGTADACYSMALNWKPRLAERGARECSPVTI